MGGTIVTSTKWREEETIGNIWSPKWAHGTCLSAEYVALLELMKSIVKNTKYVDEGKIEIHMDSLTVCNNITSQRLKASVLAGDGGAIISQIRRIENNANVEIVCVHVNAKRLAAETRNNAGTRLLLYCDIRLKNTRKSCEKENREEYLPVKGHGSLCIKGKRCKKQQQKLSK